MKTIFKVLLSLCSLLYFSEGVFGNPFDECSGAIVLTPGLPGVDTCANPSIYDAAGATQSNPYANCDGILTSICRDVWFTFKATATSQTIQVDGSSSYVALVEAFSGTCGNLTSIACASAVSAGAMVTMTLTGLGAGQNYFFRVYHRSASIPATTNFTVCLLTAPTNDECAGAINITPDTPGDKNCNSTTTFNASLASQSRSFASCDGISTTNVRDVWFSFKASSYSHTIVVDGSSSYFTILEGFSGSCGSLVSIGCSSASSTGSVATLQLTGLKVGQTYYFRVYHRSASIPSTSTFSVCLQSGPVNDECGGAITIISNSPGDKNCTPATFDAALASQTRSFAPCDGASTSLARDVWFTFKATATSHTLEVVGSSSYFAIAEAFRGNCAGLISIGCASASSTGSNATLQLTGLKPDSIYYFRVYHRSSTIPSTTTFKLCLFTAIANDECQNAIQLLPNAPLDTCQKKGTYFTDFSSQTLPFVSCDNSSTSFARDVWFKITPTATSHSIIVDGSSSYYALVEAFSGSCSSLVSIGCAAASSTGGIATLVLTGLTPGNNYFIRVYHRSSLIPINPSFEICIRTPAPNDECEQAIIMTPNSPGSLNCSNPITGDGNLATQSLSFASCDNGSTSNTRDVWFKFIATATSHTITADGSSSYYPIIEAFSGNCSTLNSIGCAISSSTGGTATLFLTGLKVGNNYYVRVYHRSSLIPTTTTFKLCLNTAPANDESCFAQELLPGFTCNYDTADASLASQTNPYASCDVNMPSIARDIWFKFKATSANQTITVDGSSSYFAILEAFSGTCSSLNPIGCSPAKATGGIATLKLTGLTSGNTYFARVYHRTSTAPATTKMEICVTDDLSTTMEESDANQVLSVYPNPASNDLYIKIPKEFKPYNLSIFSPDGKKCSSTIINDHDSEFFNVDISNLSPGIYYLTLESINEKIITRFFKN